MTQPFTADEIADEIAAALDSRMVREGTEDPTWIGAYSATLNEVEVSTGAQKFRVTVEEVLSE